MTLARLLVLLSLDATGFNRGIYLAMGQMQALERSLTNFSNLSASLSSVGGLFTRYLTVPLLSVVAAATVMGTSINKEMGQVQTLLSGGLAETTQRAIELRGVAQEMAIQFAIGTSQMTEGMYEMISAFGDSELALTGLAKAATIAKAGNVDMLDTVRMLIGASKTWREGNEDLGNTMQRISDYAFAAAAMGQTTIPELVDSIGKVGPMAQQAGVSLREFFTVFATVPGTIGTTSQVATMFRSVLRSLLDPTKALSAAYKELGISNIDATIKAQGFVPVLQQLLKYSGDNGESFGNLIGRVEGWTIALALAGQLNDEYNQTFEELGNVLGSTDRAFQTVTQGIGAQAFQWEQLGVKAQVLLQKLQEGLAPALGVVLDKLVPVTDKAIELADAFAKLDPETQQQIVNWGLLAVALGPALRILSGVVTTISLLWGVVSTVAPAIAAGLLAIAWPLALIMAAITVLAIAWNFNWFNIQERTAAASAVIQEHVGRLGELLRAGDIIGFFKELGDTIGGAINAFAGFDIVGKTIGAIKDTIGSLGPALAGIAAAGAILASVGVQGVLAAIGAALAALTGPIGLVLAAITILALAWNQNWFGIREKTYAAVEGIKAAWNGLVSGVQQLGASVKAGFQTVVVAAAGVIPAIRAAFNVNWGSIGSAITSGIAAGIRAGAGTIASAAASAASAALGAAKSLLGIKSPSSVMALQVGIPIAQGMALGMLNGISYIEDAAARMTQPLTGIGGQGFAFGGAGGGGMVIQIENNFHGPVDAATVAQVEDANRRSITVALRGEGYL